MATADNTCCYDSTVQAVAVLSGAEQGRAVQSARSTRTLVAVQHRAATVDLDDNPGL